MLPNPPAEGGAGGAGCAEVLSHVKGIRGDTGLNHRTSRGGGYGRETGIIDLGHEPPLSVERKRKQKQELERIKKTPTNQKEKIKNEKEENNVPDKKTK